MNYTINENFSFAFFSEVSDAKLLALGLTAEELVL